MSKEAEQFKCDKCGATFKDAEALLKHKAVHERGQGEDDDENDESKKAESSVGTGQLPKPPSPIPSPDPSLFPKPIQ